MATKKESEEQVNVVLTEIGEIKPWFDEKFKAWVFEHPAYPIGCESTSPGQVVKKIC